MKRVVVVDDNSMLRQNISQRLAARFQVVFQAASAVSLLDYLQHADKADLPELIVMDIEMDEINGIAATNLVKATYPDIKVVMLTVFEQSEKVWQSIMAGADGYMLKDEGKERMLDNIDDILNGGAYMTPSIATKAMQMIKAQASNHSTATEATALLTNREIEILQLVTQGLSYRQISEQLFVSVATTKTHIHNIYAKLKVANKMEAVRKVGGLPQFEKGKTMHP